MKIQHDSVRTFYVSNERRGARLTSWRDDEYKERIISPFTT